MNRARAACVALWIWSLALPAAAVQFSTYEVVIDTHGQALGAYQIEVVADDPAARIVGIEGGEHAAFGTAPYYDPAALKSEKIIIAAFSTATDLPTHATRVATLHLMEPDDCECTYKLELTVALDGDGNDIAADAELLRVEGVAQ